MKLDKMTVLVTGAGGFVGSHLTEALVERGCKVRAFVHYNSRGDWGLLELFPKNTLNALEVMRGDILDPNSARKAAAGCQVIFHLAALIAIPYSYFAPAVVTATNIGGTVNMLHAGLEAGVQRFIQTSTSEVYGTAQYVPIDEHHPLQGQSPYSASKIGADKIAESYFCSFELPVVIVRPFNIFGPRQSARAIIPTIISQTLYRDKIRLGSLIPVRDLTYVKDTVRGFIMAAETEGVLGEVFNIGTGTGISIGELANKINSITGKDNPIEQDEERIRPEKSEVMRLICGYQKAQERLGWKPSYTLEQGLQETVDFIKEHPTLYKPELYQI